MRDITGAVEDLDYALTLADTRPNVRRQSLVQRGLIRKLRNDTNGFFKVGRQRVVVYGSMPV